MTVSVTHLAKSFSPDEWVVNHVSFSIQPGEMFFLLGPSGCGKTTVLRMIAGFIPPDGGEIHFGEKFMNNVPPQDRNTAMVFQNYAIWPHLTVYENVAYGPRARKLDEETIRNRVADALRVVRLEDPPKENRRNSPAASSSGSPWRGRSRSNPASFSSTNRFPISTRASGSNCVGNSSASIAKPAPPASTSPTIRKRRCHSPTASPL